MARPSSQQVAGYFPCPQRLLPSFASILRWRRPAYHRGYVLLDPCAGDGEAIVTLRDLWAADIPPESRAYRPPTFPIRACELEAQRAEALDERLDWHDQALAGDCFRLLSLTPPETGAALLYLNPPYDHDAEYQRLEQRFLARFTGHLHPGSGWLFYLNIDSTKDAAAFGYLPHGPAGLPGLSLELHFNLLDANKQVINNVGVLSAT